MNTLTKFPLFPCRYLKSIAWLQFFQKRNYLVFLYVTTITCFCFSTHVDAKEPKELIAGIPVNYDEADVADYTLPDPLVCFDGTPVSTPEQWMSQRRSELLRIFETEQFGISPDRSEVSFDVFDEGTPAYDGKAVRKQFTVFFTKDHSRQADVVVYFPAERSGPVPVLLNISFFPNGMTVEDPDVEKGERWDREGKRVAEVGDWKPTPIDVEKFVSNGIGLATIYYGDIEPDFPKGILYGVRGYYLNVTQHYPAPDEWGSIAAWSWGLSCVMDYFETDEAVDASKVGVIGFSRLGKTALWTGVKDDRFAVVIPCLSGEGGAALSRRDFGETVAHMIAPDRFYYQFSGNRAKYGEDPSSCPVDAHELLALVAPRPLLLITGSEDYWSDSKGEFLSAVAASPVYELLGKCGLKSDEFPEVGQPITNDIGYIRHDGGHTVSQEDWDLVLQFMKQHLED